MNSRLESCPLSPVHTVAQKWDCRWIRRQSPFSATVSLFCDSVDRAFIGYCQRWLLQFRQQTVRRWRAGKFRGPKPIVRLLWAFWASAIKCDLSEFCQIEVPRKIIVSNAKSHTRSNQNYYLRPHVHKFFEQWRRGSVSLSEIFFRKSINRKGTFTLIFRKPDWTQPGKVLLLSECILECKFFMHLIVLNLDSCSPIFAPQPKNRSRAYISSGAFRPTLTTDRILMPVLWMIVAMVGVVSESRLTRLGRTLRYHMCTKSVGLHLHPRRVTKPMAPWRCMRKLSTNTAGQRCSTTGDGSDGDNKLRRIMKSATNTTDLLDRKSQTQLVRIVVQRVHNKSTKWTNRCNWVSVWKHRHQSVRCRVAITS